MTEFNLYVTHAELLPGSVLMNSKVLVRLKSADWFILIAFRISVSKFHTWPYSYKLTSGEQ